MKLLALNTLFLTIFMFSSLLVKADSWYDPYIKLYLSVDIDTMIWTGAELGQSPDPNINNWVSDLYAQDLKAQSRYDGLVTFQGACPVVDSSPTASFYIYNDLFSMNSCPGDWELFKR